MLVLPSPPSAPTSKPPSPPRRLLLLTGLTRPLPPEPPVPPDLTFKTCLAQTLPFYSQPRCLWFAAQLARNQSFMVTLLSRSLMTERPSSISPLPDPPELLFPVLWEASRPPKPPDPPVAEPLGPNDFNGAPSGDSLVSRSLPPAVFPVSLVTTVRISGIGILSRPADLGLAYAIILLDIIAWNGPLRLAKDHPFGSLALELFCLDELIFNHKLRMNGLANHVFKTIATLWEFVTISHALHQHDNLYGTSSSPLMAPISLLCERNVLVPSTLNSLFALADMFSIMKMGLVTHPSKLQFKPLQAVEDNGFQVSLAATLVLMLMNPSLSAIPVTLKVVYWILTPVPISPLVLPLYEDHLPLCEDSLPLYEDPLPLYEDLSRYEDSLPLYEDSLPLYEDLPLHEDHVTLPLYEDLGSLMEFVTPLSSPSGLNGCVSRVVIKGSFNRCLIASVAILEMENCALVAVPISGVRSRTQGVILLNNCIVDEIRGLLQDFYLFKCHVAIIPLCLSTYFVIISAFYAFMAMLFRNTYSLELLIKSI